MANPAPTINQINAFNATQGAIIDFNIIGGTELVRSNRIYIYDLSDNSLICTHLYVSTESIHELPTNTDGSIVYESGKSSADFVNGAQYYAQIQTYTDTAGTEGGSGLSVAKMFWCLVNPTLTITTIPSTISTTSYNVSATYDSNTSVVSNIIQQYQFNLYSATGSLLQSSGVVVGSGEQQGTSTTYGISYNFTGLSVGSSYYVVVDVTTTQGMSVSTQSNTFTVSIDTPTLGEATVVNNACDGYISVTSNLSGEYGGSASGEIASFVTSSVNDISSLKVTLDPIQDLHGYDKPWVGGAGKNLFDVSYLTGQSANGVYFTAQNDGRVKASGTAVTQGWTYINRSFTLPYNGIDAGDQILLYGSAQLYVRFYDDTYAQVGSAVTRQPSNTATTTVPSSATKMEIYVYTGYTYPSAGQTVNETLEFYISKDLTFTSWTPYTNICPISGWDEVETVVSGVNVLVNEAESGASNGVIWTVNEDKSISLSGTATANAFIELGGPYYLKGGTYTMHASGNANIQINLRIGSISGSNAIQGATVNQTKAITSGTYAGIIRIGNGTNVDGVTLYPQLELGSTATVYEPYNAHTYTTDLPQTVYGGTLDVVSGVLTVDRAMVNLGSLNWNFGKPFGGQNEFFWASGLSGLAVFSPVSAKTDAISSSFEAESASTMNSQYSATDGSFALFNNWVIVHDSQYTDATAFKTTMNGVQLVYELATPQTYQLTPQEIQTLLGRNNVWSDGAVSVAYNIPITNLLVKRQDVADVSGTWLTLYSQPITQASDMDFTFIDFLNQYGKTYKYALVPLLTQTQSGVEVEVEGGYTVSDEVQSVFDGVFIADQTGSQKCKANVGYGDVDMNQAVGTITPIGAKYPVVITNSKNQYHNGSISGTIVPDDYYFNGNLSRIDMVNKRNELEQFLTNKRAKIIKDWNSNIWLVMIIDNINCSFDNNYGMGMVNFNASWIEVGDPTNQQDLQAAGLIDVGGV